MVIHMMKSTYYNNISKRGQHANGPKVRAKQTIKYRVYLILIRISQQLYTSQRDRLQNLAQL